MSKQVIFIQGAGEGAHEADAKLVESLRSALGPDYNVVFPVMPNEANPHYEEWRSALEKEVTKAQEPIIFIAHSAGASILLKWLSETKTQKVINGIFLLASPFWGGSGWRYEDYEKLELPKDIERILPRDASVFLYHSQDDDIVPYEHLALYADLLPHATKRQLKEGGHQFNNDLSLVAKDIKRLRIDF